MGSKPGGTNGGPFRLGDQRSRIPFKTPTLREHFGSPNQLHPVNPRIFIVSELVMVPKLSSIPKRQKRPFTSPFLPVFKAHKNGDIFCFGGISPN